MQDNNEIELLKSQIQSMKDEFRQYKQRVKENEERYHEKTKKEFIKNLLATLDSLNRTINDIYGEEETRERCELIKKISKGRGDNLKMIYDDLLGSYGIIPITPKRGETFDDVKHTALEVICDADYSENTVVGVVRNGYVFSGEIIRPAEVVISRGGGTGLFKKKEKEKKGGVFSNIREYIIKFIESKILKEKSSELNFREEKIIKKEIELKRESEELSNKTLEIKEKENDLAGNENDVLGREQKIREHTEKTMLALIDDLNVREQKIKERDLAAIINEENTNKKLSELKNREDKLDELIHQLNIREENVNIKENEIGDKIAQLAQLEFRVGELSLNKTKVEEGCAKLKKSMEDYGLKEKEYNEVNKK